MSTEGYDRSYAVLGLSAQEDQMWLGQTVRPDYGGPAPLRLADMFAGCGGMSLGALEALRFHGQNGEVALACEFDKQIATVFDRNLAPSVLNTVSIAELFPGEIGESLQEVESEVRQSAGPIDILLGGPPCQGHSNLNNHTRRRDPKNALYRRMGRVAEVLNPKLVVIENVPGVRHDKRDVLHWTTINLKLLGYHVESFTLYAEQFGVAQRRRRVFLVGSKAPFDAVNLKSRIETLFRVKERSLGWAISGIRAKNGENLMLKPTLSRPETQSRIDWLFDNQQYNLPDSRRPDCHRNHSHTYKSVYGRLRWDQPATTITSGFSVMGQGRFVHPLERRTLIPAEAARIQFFPDWFEFAPAKKKDLVTMIANAVPPKLAFVVVAAAMENFADR